MPSTRRRLMWQSGAAKIRYIHLGLANAAAAMLLGLCLAVAAVTRLLFPGAMRM